MSENDNNKSRLDLTSDMTNDWDSELNEDELENPEEMNLTHDEISSNKDEDLEDSIDPDEDLKEDELEDSENQEYDEDDLEDESEPSLLQTKSGKILVGAAAFGVSIVGLAGYIVLGSGGGEQIEPQSVEPARIKPIYGDETSFVAKEKDESKNNSELVQPNTKNDLLAKNETQDLKIDFNEVKTSNEKKVEDNSSLSIDFENNNLLASNKEVPKDDSKSFDLSLGNKAKDSEAKLDDNLSAKTNKELVNKVNDQLVAKVNNPTIPASIETKVSSIEVKEIEEKVDNINKALENKVKKEDVSIIAEDVAQKVAEDIFRNQNQEDQTKIASLENKVSELTKLINEKISSEEAKGSENNKNISADSLNRERLKGFKIINTTMDGTMSVVKAPSGRTIILYKGEKFYVKDKGTFVVNNVLNNGHLLLANKHYFIDTVYEKPLEVPKEKKEPMKNKATVKMTKKEPVVISTPAKKESEVTVSSYEKAKDINVARLANNININSSKKIATGFTWNGQMGNEYIIQLPNGDWEMVKTGDTIEGLGLVNGLSDNNNLIVGEFVIEKSKD